MGLRICVLISMLWAGLSAWGGEFYEPPPLADASEVQREFDTKYLVGFEKTLAEHLDLDLELTTGDSGKVEVVRIFRGPRPVVRPLDDAAKAEVRKCLAELSNEAFQVRDEATTTLIHMGRDVEPLLLDWLRGEQDSQGRHSGTIVFRAISGELDLRDAVAFLRSISFGGTAGGKRFLLTVRKAELDATKPAQKEFPFWNGSESGEAYAERVGLPARRLLLLGQGESMEFVLVPRARFVMGALEPAQPVRRPEDSLLWAYLGGAALAILVLTTVLLSARMRRRPQYSLRYFFLLTMAAALALWGVVEWRRATDAQEAYAAALRSYFRLAQAEREHAQEIELARPFYLSKCEVTWKQFVAVMGSEILEGPLAFRNRVGWNHMLMKAQPNGPAMNPNVWSIRSYCQEIGGLAGTPCRIPTEAEWEFACRMGKPNGYGFGDSSQELEKYAWYADSIVDKSKIPNFNQANWDALLRMKLEERTYWLWNTYKAWPQAVGLKMPNEWGLYDMHGNVWELCFAQGKPGVPHFMEAQPLDVWNNRFPLFVLKGGCISSVAEECRTAFRIAECLPDECKRPAFWISHLYGFRVLMEVDAPKPFDPDHLQR